MISVWVFRDSGEERDRKILSSLLIDKRAQQLVFNKI